MTIHIVIQPWDYSLAEIKGAFLSKQKADAYLAEVKRSDENGRNTKVVTIEVE